MPPLYTGLTAVVGDTLERRIMNYTQPHRATPSLIDGVSNVEHVRGQTKSELISLFSTAVVKTNIGREFTEEELQLFNTGIPMARDGNVADEYVSKEYEMMKVNIEHPKLETYSSQSLDYQLFNTFTEELKDIKTFCEQELKGYLEEIEGVDTDITTLQITQSWFTKLNPQELHGLHNHRNSYLSGVLYFRCLPNDFIQFTNRNFLFDQSLELPKKKTTKFTAKIAKVNILTYQIITCLLVEMDTEKDLKVTRKNTLTSLTTLLREVYSRRSVKRS